MIGNGTYIGKKGKSSSGAPPSNIFFEDDFESYAENSEIAGQNGWIGASGYQSPVIKKTGENKYLAFVNSSYPGEYTACYREEPLDNFIISVTAQLNSEFFLNPCCTSGWSGQLSLTIYADLTWSYLSLGDDTPVYRESAFNVGDIIGMKIEGYKITMLLNGAIDTLWPVCDFGNNGVYTITGATIANCFKGKYVFLYPGRVPASVTNIYDFKIETI